MLKRLFLLLILIQLAACAPNYGVLQQKIVSNVSKKNYNEALKIVEENYDRKESLLLNNLEKGTIYYLNNDYNNALKHFDEAEKISEDLYTISITSKLKSTVNDSLDDYGGRKYENGLIRFYKSLIYYKLYLDKNIDNDTRLSYLRKSRSNIIKWNSINNSYTDKDYYNEDLLQKIWGYYIYKENNDSRSRTSLNSANKVLFNYYVFPSYNKNNDKFRENFFKLNKKDLEKLVVETDFSKSIKNFINSDNKNNNFTILFKDGFINNIKVRKVKIPLIFSMFADQSPEFFNFLSLLIIFDTEGNPSIDIQLPYFEKPLKNDKVFVELYDLKNNKIKDFELLLIEPLNEIAYDDFEKNKEGEYSKLILATSTKYIAAITSAYQIYKSSNNNIIPALIYYTGLKKTIDATSIPDIRQWSLLPKNIMFNSVNVPNGSYKLKIKKSNKYIFEKNIVVNGDFFIDI